MRRDDYVEIPVFPVDLYPWQCGHCGTPLRARDLGGSCPICGSVRVEPRLEDEA